MTGKSVTIATGQRWKLRGDDQNAWWTVVSVAPDGQVGLSGPTVCRAWQQVLDDELIEKWERVER